MSPEERLAAIKARFPRWTIARAPGNMIGYVARQGREYLYSPHLTGLETKLEEFEKGR